MLFSATPSYGTSVAGCGTPRRQAQCEALQEPVPLVVWSPGVARKVCSARTTTEPPYYLPFVPAEPLDEKLPSTGTQRTMSIGPSQARFEARPRASSKG